MALCTSEFVGISSNIMWADFRDTHALFYPKAGRFIGYNQDGVMLLGKKDLSLVNGVWIAEEDLNLMSKFPDIPALELELCLIE